MHYCSDYSARQYQLLQPVQVQAGLILLQTPSRIPTAALPLDHCICVTVSVHCCSEVLLVPASKRQSTLTQLALARQLAQVGKWRKPAGMLGKMSAFKLPRLVGAGQVFDPAVVAIRVMYPLQA
jgi:hypothetical protein